MNIFRQFIKFIKVTAYIQKQYFKIFYDYKSASEFFTKLYMQSLDDQDQLSHLTIKRKTLEEIFPGINSQPIISYAEYGSLFFDKFNVTKGYLVSPKEMFTINAIIKFVKPQTLFEIGTYRGWTTTNIIQNLDSDQLIVTLDISKKDSHSDYVDQTLALPNVSRIFADSQTYDFRPYTRKMDLIFIDACHSEAAVKSDTETAMHMIKPQGMIIWHDYNEEMEGVVTYLNQLAKTLPLIWIKNTALVIYIK